MTKAERTVMEDLQAAATKSMRSKTTLRILSRLQDQGLIEFDPFTGAAKETAAGLLAMLHADT